MVIFLFLFEIYILPNLSLIIENAVHSHCMHWIIIEYFIHAITHVKQYSIVNNYVLYYYKLFFFFKNISFYSMCL